MIGFNQIQIKNETSETYFFFILNFKQIFIKYANQLLYNDITQHRIKAANMVYQFLN